MAERYVDTLFGRMEDTLIGSRARWRSRAKWCHQMGDQWQKRYWHDLSRTRKTVTVVAAALLGLTVLATLTEKPPESWVASARGQCLYHANLQSRFGVPRWPSAMFAHRAYDADDAKLGIATLVEPDVQFLNGSGGWERVTVSCTYNRVTHEVTDIGGAFP